MTWIPMHLKQKLAVLTAVLLMVLSFVTMDYGSHSGAVPQNVQAADVWEPLRFLIGTWEGTGKGKPGKSQVERAYALFFGDKFIQVRNRSTYAPQEKNPKGERHEDWGMLSFDKARQQFVMRQFHSEGFVNHYVMDKAVGDEKALVFQAESIENVPPGWHGP